MRWIKIVMVLTIVSTIALYAQDKKKKNDDVCFTVSMSCHNCQAKIEKNIPWEKGVKDLKVNLDDKTVCIVYDKKKTSPEKLKKAIEELEFICEIKE
ncbi:MAG: cation transporter [Tannerellaceae bacterium]|jgi:copper chaperone CopZ|nr:cation transporter [Tannerellaceae bacterium]